MAPEATPDSDLLDFVEVSLEQRALSGICRMLERAVQAMGAWGSFLWQLTEDNDLQSSPPVGSLFVLAEWFLREHPWALEKLGLDSASGRVVIQNRPENITSVARYRKTVGQTHRWWLEQNGVKCFCAVPVEFEDAKATLNFYRLDDRPFSDREVARAARIGRLFPRLYQSVRNQVSFDLLRDIESKTLENQNTSEELVGNAVQEVCALIGQTFDCFECSIFLENRLQAPGVLRKMAATWTPVPDAPHAEYRRDDHGAVPWIWREARPVRFSNITDLLPGTEPDPERYPGLIWNDPLGIQQAVSDFLAVPMRSLPPLSYMATPITAGGNVLGVVRCSAAIKSPYFYAKWELKLLQLAAADIGYWWESRLRRLELDVETRAWRLFIDKVRGLNDRMNEIMAKPLPDEAAIDEQCRVVSEKAGAEAMLDLVEQQKKLYKVLFQMIRSRQENESELQRKSEADRRFYEDLFHQLKSPIFTATATSRMASQSDRTLEFYRTNLAKLRAQMSKAERVTRAVQVFAELAKDRPPKPELVPLDLQYLLRTLVWAKEDHERLFEDKQLKFNVERAGFNGVRNHPVSVDMDLLSHAINNLLDNAGKYSFNGGTVRIFGGITNTGRFHISVANKGLRLRPGESRECLTRGWRGREAQMVTGEGSGLGLWIVDQIMQAHSGQALIIAPNSEDEFEAKLLFLR